MSWRRLLEGATRPSPAGLLGTLAVTGIWVLLTALFLGPSTLAGHRWVAEPIDDFAWLAGNIVRYQQADAATLQVAVLGTSATREAISDGAGLQAELEVLLDRPVRVHLLTAGSLYPLEYLVVADHLPVGASGVLVVEVSERQLGLDPQTWRWLAANPRLPLDSPSYRTAVAEAGFEPRSRIPGLYLSEHLDFFAARLAPRALQGFAPVPYDLHPVDVLAPPADRDWARMRENWEGWLASFEAYHEPVVPTLRGLVERAHGTTGSRVAFLQAPRNPQFIEWVAGQAPVAGERNEAYQGRVQQLSRELGVPLWDLLEAADVRAEDFRDHAHLGEPEARERYTRALAEAVAAVAPPEGTP